jgi:hypothetical protein
MDQCIMDGQRFNPQERRSPILGSKDRDPDAIAE